MDIIGWKVIGPDGEMVGRVEELLVGESDHKVRYLEITRRGLFGLYERRYLYPASCVRSALDGTLTIGHRFRQINSNRQFTPTEVLRQENWKIVPAHYVQSWNERRWSGERPEVH